MKLGERTAKKENQKTKTLKIRRTVGLKHFVSYVGKGEPLSVQFVIGVFTGTVLKLFDSSKYEFNTDSVILKVDTEGSWVCGTCDKYLKKKHTWTGCDK